MAVLPYLKKVDLQDFPAGALTWYDCMTSTPDRHYIVTNGSSARILVYDMEGNRQTSEEIALGDSGNSSDTWYSGITVYGNNIYLVRSLPFSNNYYPIQVVVYSKTGVAGTGFTWNGVQHRQPMNPSGMYFGGTTFRIILVYDIYTGDFPFGLILTDYKKVVMSFSSSGAVGNYTILPSEISRADSTCLAFGDNGFYIYSREDNKIYRTDANFGIISGDTITPETDNSRTFGMGWNGGAVCCFDETDEAIYHYGVDPVVPVAVDVPSVKQYDGFKNWELRFDAVKPGTGSDISEVRGVNLPGLVESTASFVDLSTDVTIATQTASVTIILKNTLPSIEIGDVLFINNRTGSAKTEDPSALPSSGQMRVEGQLTVGNKRRQGLICTLL